MEGRKKIDAYLSRISVAADRDLAPTIESLRMLQTRHLLSVPFENLDIHWKRPIVLNTERFYEKIAVNGRGGFCYELNGLFNGLLCDLGFKTRLVSARVFAGERGFGPEFDHAAIIVSLDEKEYLVDVGFGDFAAESLEIADGVEQADREGTFRINSVENGSFVVEKKNGDEWRNAYMFGTRDRDVAEFAEMCDFQQYSPDSHFTKGKLCSLMTDNGRKTLTDGKFVVTSNGEKTETTVGSEEEFEEILLQEFGIQQASIATSFS